MALASGTAGPVLAGPLCEADKRVGNGRHRHTRFPSTARGEMASAAAVQTLEVPDMPHQPLGFSLPKRSFGKKIPIF